jgi:hypothetical protein
MGDAERFLQALAGKLPDDERLILCGFVGDPETAGPTAWRPRPWRPGREIVLSPKANGYVTVGSFRRAGDGSFRRRTETFAAGLALMVDDVGTKVPLGSMVAENGYPILPPSAIVETSPGNFQWWYFLAEPERDMVRFDGVIRAFISGKLLGADPGMSGVTRVGRIPGFVNGKAKHNGWVVRLVTLDDRRYTIGEMLDAFKLTINGRRVIREQLPTEDAIERNRAFSGVFKFLGQRGMLKKEHPDPSGWTEMSCPWIGDHTNGADTGAAIREPAAENDYYGAFRCHHGHCADKGWSELTEWINELAAEELAAAGDRDAETNIQ